MPAKVPTVEGHSINDKPSLPEWSPRETGKRPRAFGYIILTFFICRKQPPESPFQVSEAVSKEGPERSVHGAGFLQLPCIDQPWPEALILLESAKPVFHLWRLTQVSGFRARGKCMTSSLLASVLDG